jgi:hypothetical protein
MCSRDTAGPDSDRQAFVDLFISTGLVDVEQPTQRSLQFVTARKPG